MFSVNSRSIMGFLGPFLPVLGPFSPIFWCILAVLALFLGVFWGAGALTGAIRLVTGVTGVTDVADVADVSASVSARVMGWDDSRSAAEASARAFSRSGFTFLPFLVVGVVPGALRPPEL